MPDPTARDGEIIRLRNRTRALEANGAELLARAERAEAMTADSREQIERIQAERDAMPQDERTRREAADAPLLRIQLAHYAGENERLKAELALHVGCRVDIPIGDALKLIRATDSPATAPTPVTAATEAHGGAGEAQEGSQWAR